MTHSLETLAPGVLVYLATTPHPSRTNLGVIVAADGMTIIDSGLVPAQASGLADELSQISDAPLRRLVLTSSHIDAVGGSAAFPLAAVYGSAQTSAHLDQPINFDVCAALHPGYDFAELETRSITHTVAEAAHLCPASIAVPCSGPQYENLVVQVPAANVVFAGAVLTNGIVPLGFESDMPAWIESLETVTGYGELFVPGHGPMCGGEEIEILASYLHACLDARGAVSGLADGPWSSWEAPHRHAINVERAAMFAAGDPSPPPSLLALLGR